MYRPKVAARAGKLELDRRYLRGVFRSADNKIAAMTRSVTRRGAGGGRKYWLGPGHTYQASAPGQPPVSRIVEPLAAITSALSVAGMARLAFAWGEFGEKLSIASQRIGISTGRLQALQGGARRTSSFCRICDADGRAWRNTPRKRGIMA
jgi:hypothetical protein